MTDYDVVVVGAGNAALAAAVSALGRQAWTIGLDLRNHDGCRQAVDAIAEAVDELGMRAVLCYEVSDRDGADVAAAGIAENERYLNRLKLGHDAEGDDRPQAEAEGMKEFADYGARSSRHGPDSRFW